MQTLAYLPWANTSYESEALPPANTSYESDLKKPRLSDLYSQIKREADVPPTEAKAPSLINKLHFISFMKLCDFHLAKNKHSPRVKSYISHDDKLGVDIINLEKMWDQMQKAAEKIVAVDNTRDILVASDSMMPRYVHNFVENTGTSALTCQHCGLTCQDYSLGTLTTGNKPRLLILTYPKNENHMRLIEEANLAKIPMIAFCETDCPMKYVDGGAIVIPADFNEIALPWLFWFLSKMILHYRGLLPQDKQWESSSPYDIDRWEEWEWAVCEEKNCNNVKYQHQKEEEEEYCTRKDRQVEMIVTEVILEKKEKTFLNWKSGILLDGKTGISAGVPEWKDME
ncbi:hypothetical protein OROGR_022942 [Orobanche gracilis]